MKKDMLFQRCRCKAYLKKVRDSAYIHRMEPWETESGEEEFVLEYGNHVVPEDAPMVSPCEGVYDIEKTYYGRRELEFTGVCVGFKTIKTEGYLGVEYVDPPYGNPFHRVFKEPKTQVDCAIVYFANNQKRFVPLDDIEIESMADKKGTTA